MAGRGVYVLLLALLLSCLEDARVMTQSNNIDTSMITPSPMTLIDSSMSTSSPMTVIDSSMSTPSPMTVIDSSMSTSSPMTVIDSSMSTPSPMTLIDSSMSTSSPMTLTSTPEMTSELSPLFSTDLMSTTTSPSLVTLSADVTATLATESFSSLISPSSSSLTLPSSSLSPPITNKAPVISPPLSLVFTVREGLMVETNIATLFVEDPERNLFSCNINYTFPSNGPFAVLRETAGNPNRYELKYITRTKLVRNQTALWTVLVTCRDSTDLYSNVTLDIQVLGNNPPAFASNPTTARVDVSTANDTVIYHVRTTDADLDAVTCSLTSAQNYVKIDPNSCQIRPNINFCTAAVSPFTVNVTLNDGIGDSLTTLTIIFTIDNFNVAPDIANLPAAITVDENSVNNIYTLNFTDDSATFVNFFPVSTISPPIGTNYFEYRNTSFTYRIRSLSNFPLDYESGLVYFEIKAVISDECKTNPADDILRITIRDVNEPPIFHGTPYLCTLDESDAQVSECNPRINVTDPEQQALTSLTVDSINNANRFQYSPATGRLTFAVNYDVDNGFPMSQIVLLTTSDPGGLTATATVSVVVQDVNDNPPVFTTSSVPVTIDQTTTLSSTLGACVATDADRTSPNNAITYSQIPPPLQSDYIVSIGTLIRYSRQIPESLNGSSFILYIVAKDGGTPALSATCTVIASYQSFVTTTTSTTTTTTTPTTTTPTTTTPTTTTTTASTTTTTTTAAPAFASTDAGIALIVFVSLLSLALLALIGYLIYRFCLGGGLGGGARGGGGALCKPGQLCGKGGQCDCGCCECCQPEPTPRKVTPVQPLRRDPNYKDDFWRTDDHYEDGRARSEPKFTNLNNHRATPPNRVTPFDFDNNNGFNNNNNNNNNGFNNYGNGTNNYRNYGDNLDSYNNYGSRAPPMGRPSRF